MKIEDSIATIRQAVWDHPPAAVMLSFGKDSMVLAALIREASRGTQGFPLPVIFHRVPWFTHKYEFADSVIRSWAMEVHDWTPMHAGIKVKPDRIELVARYNFGNGVMDVPVNTLSPTHYPRRDYICALNDWLGRPKSPGTLHRWKTIFHGHKSADVDQFEGPVPLNRGAVTIGGIRLVFPLRDWTDADVWDYIEANHIPYQKSRYANRAELSDTWANPDYIHACTACIDPREKSNAVFCPKLKRQVPNVSAKVLQLNDKTDYIGEQAA